MRPSIVLKDGGRQPTGLQISTGKGLCNSKIHSAVDVRGRWGVLSESSTEHRNIQALLQLLKRTYFLNSASYSSSQVLLLLIGDRTSSQCRWFLHGIVLCPFHRPKGKTKALAIIFCDLVSLICYELPQVY